MSAGGRVAGCDWRGGVAIGVRPGRDGSGRDGCGIGAVPGTTREGSFDGCGCTPPGGGEKIVPPAAVSPGASESGGRVNGEWTSHSRIGSVPGMNTSLKSSSLGQKGFARRPVERSMLRVMIASGRGQSGGVGRRR